jgi:hypothetical protein
VGFVLVLVAVDEPDSLTGLDFDDLRSEAEGGATSSLGLKISLPMVRTVLPEFAPTDPALTMASAKAATTMMISLRMTPSCREASVSTSAACQRGGARG